MPYNRSRVVHRYISWGTGSRKQRFTVCVNCSIKDFAEKHELDKFFLYGFGSHHFYLHQRYTSDPEMVMQHRVLSVHF